MAPDFFAHSVPGQPVSAWQPLDVHLRNVAQRAAEFARPFGAHHWAWLAGAHHDVGKGTLAWQAYLRHANAVMDELAMHYSGPAKHSSVIWPRPIWARCWALLESHEFDEYRACHEACEYKQKHQDLYADGGVSRTSGDQTPSNRII